MNIFFKSIFLLSILLTLQAKSQNLLINGDFEQGQGGVGVVPDFWELVSGTPDHCQSAPTTCNLPPVVTTPSPQGGKWVRFFYASTNQGINNEIFGQQLQTPLVQGQEYRITLYIAHTSINPIFPATPTSSIRIGFSNGNPTNQVGQFDRQDLVTDAIDTWVQRSYTFIASGNFNFISIGKTAQEMQNACYVDDIVLETTCAVSLGSNLTLCDGEEFTLDATRPDGTYLWHDGSTNPTFTGNTAGTYYVEVITPECTSSDTITVTYLPIINFSINFGNDTTLCEGESLNLALNVPNATYLWQNNSTNNNFNVTTSGQYYVTATVNLCSIQSDTINVSFISPTSVNLGNDTTLCEGESLVLSISTPGATYVWQDNSTNPTFTVSNAGTYSVVVTAANGCSNEFSINAQFNAPPELDLGEDSVSTCKSSPIIFDAFTPNATYLWQDESTDSEFEPTVTGDYYVQVTVGPCVVSDTVHVTLIDCAIIIEMPNVFTPNGDAINDVFIPKSYEGISSARMIILNRWGRTIFETENIEEGWNGESANDKSPEGVYFYIVAFTDIENKQGELKGTVTLMR